MKSKNCITKPDYINLIETRSLGGTNHGREKKNEDITNQPLFIIISITMLL